MRANHKSTWQIATFCGHTAEDATSALDLFKILYYPDLLRGDISETHRVEAVIYYHRDFAAYRLITKGSTDPVSPRFIPDWKQHWRNVGGDAYQFFRKIAADNIGYASGYATGMFERYWHQARNWQPICKEKDTP